MSNLFGSQSPALSCPAAIPPGSMWVLGSPRPRAQAPCAAACLPLLSRLTPVPESPILSPREPFSLYFVPQTLSVQQILFPQELTFLKRKQGRPRAAFALLTATSLSGHMRGGSHAARRGRGESRRRPYLKTVSPAWFEIREKITPMVVWKRARRVTEAR